MTRQGGDHIELDDDALKAVANGTRLRLVESLGEAVEGGGYGTRRFSELMTEVGLSDSGRMAYHLDKLRKQAYVERTDDGYRLTLRGLRIYQFVRSGVLSRSPEVGPFETDLVHEACGNPLSIRYENQRVCGICETCGVTVESVPVRPSSFDPDRLETLERAMQRQLWAENFTLTQGCCLHCGGTVETDFRSPHEDGGDGASVDGPQVLFVCNVCHWFHTAGVAYAGYLHPAVVAFCHERDLDIREHHLLDPPVDVPRPEVRSEDPWRVAVTYAYENDAITLTFDDDLTVHSVTTQQGGAASPQA